MRELHDPVPAAENQSEPQNAATAQVRLDERGRITLDADAATLARQEEMIAQIDRESATRKFKGITQKMVFWFCVLVSLYHLYCCAYLPPVTLKHRSLHVGVMLALCFAYYPISGKKRRKDGGIPWYDWGFIVLSLGIPAYMWTNYLGVVDRAGRASTMDAVMATLLVLLVLEAARRSNGLSLPILSLVFIAYGLWGGGLPGFFAHRPYSWTVLSNHFFANTEGIFGTSVGVSSSYIFLFILFGAVMAKCGMGKFFNDIALALAGGARGGPAKVSVVASGFLGSINGSAVANVVTTGTFTIPLMKKSGYSREFAGAVEAASSVGGQIMPPVMGAAAFIMSEMLGVKYSQICICAIIPAMIYYLGILFQVDLRAQKNRLVGLPGDQLPRVGEVMKQGGHLLIPIAILLYLMLFSGKTVLFSAFWSVVSIVVVSSLRKSTRMTPMQVIEALADGARQTVSVAIACACVGIIIGVTSKTGFGLAMAHSIVTLGRHNLLFTLIFTMVTCMILGMGLPSIPAYIITTTIATPALVELGITDIAAHLFAFYFGMFANLTPPVALAAFAAAGLSGGDAWKTGWASVKLVLAGFLVPYMFVYSNKLLLLDTTFLEGTRVVIGAVIAVFMIATAVEGHCFTRMPNWLRAITLCGALLAMDPKMLTAVIGLAALAGMLTFQRAKRGRERAAQQAPV